MDYAFGLAEAHEAHVIGVGHSPLGIEKLWRKDGRRLMTVPARASGAAVHGDAPNRCSIGDLPDEMVLTPATSISP